MALFIFVVPIVSKPDSNTLLRFLGEPISVSALNELLPVSLKLLLSSASLLVLN